MLKDFSFNFFKIPSFAEAWIAITQETYEPVWLYLHVLDILVVP